MLEWGFVLKKAISAFLLPIPMVCMMIFLGLLLREKKPRWARVLLLAGPSYLLLLSFSPVSTYLAHSLEAHHPIWQPQAEFTHVLVLGSGHQLAPSRPAQMQLSAIARGRLLEGIRVWQHHSEAMLVFSGAVDRQGMAHAELMKQAAVELGVPAEQIMLLLTARDTDDEARLTAELIGQSPAVLVTSASHMDRALALYRAYGATVMPAPADFMAMPTQPWYFGAQNLWISQRALHEYIGRVWFYLRS